MAFFASYSGSTIPGHHERSFYKGCLLSFGLDEVLSLSLSAMFGHLGAEAHDATEQIDKVAGVGAR